MVDCITLTVPAKESALMVVRLTAAGVAARMEMDLETLDDVKTILAKTYYEGIVKICAEGAWRETAGKVPDLKLCYAVLTTMIPHVKVDMDERKIRCIELHR